MKLVVVLTCLLAGCLANKPQPCESPALLTGQLTLSIQNEQLFTSAKYLYDGLGQRVRVMELGAFENKTFTYDALLLYKEATMYEIHEHNRTCRKLPLKGDFQPIAIPKDAALVGQVVLGSSSEPGQGLLVNTWAGELPDKGGKYGSTVTESGCIPVSSMVQTSQFGWVFTSFFNHVQGIPDPNQLNPPDFCSDSEMSGEEGPTDFFSVFLNRK